MAEVFFFVSPVIYGVVSAKIDEWMTIYYLGFEHYTPQGFLRNPKLYNRFRAVLFLIALALCFLMQSLSWYVALVLLLLVWLLAGGRGRRRAFSSYREVHRRLSASARTDAEREEFEKGANVSDQELYEIVKMRTKYLV